MTARADRDSSGLLLVVLAAVVLLALAGMATAPLEAALDAVPAATAADDICRMVVGDTTLEWSKHATEKHGVDAVQVRQRFLASVTQRTFDRPPCKDGRWRFVTQIGENAWDISVWERMPGQVNTYQEVTSFYTRDKNYAERVKAMCGNDDDMGVAA